MATVKNKISKKTIKRLVEIFEQLDDKVDLHNSFTIDWTLKGIGFGQYRFYKKDGKIYCSNECMNKESIKRVLNTLVDECELEDK